MEYQNKTLQTVSKILVYENKINVESTGKALCAVSLCTLAEYRLNTINKIAIMIK